MNDSNYNIADPNTVLPMFQSLDSDPSYGVKLIRSNGSELLVNKISDNDIYFPMDIIENRNDPFLKELDNSFDAYIHNQNDLPLSLLLDGDIKIEHSLIKALSFPEMEIHHQFDPISNEIEITNYSNDNCIDPCYLIDKTEIFDKLNEFSSNFNDETAKQNHQFFIDKLVTIFEELEIQTSNGTNCEDPSTEIPDDYIEIINNLLSFHDQKTKIVSETSDSVCYHRIISENEIVDEYENLKAKMLMVFPFELDSFQKQAICLIHKNENVLVAAHTSAGKTVIAEYAIACAEIVGKKAIYTSPIKALSNQKYYDFRKRFRDVGIVTGDIQINEHAQVVIMTTEILRSILYRSLHSRLNDVTYVIFDEAHYLNDEERGVVWEEILIMLPSHIRLVLLSATIPNCHEVAQWIGHVRKQTINVIITYKRPVPLQHILYYGKSHESRNNALSVIDSSGFFNERNFRFIENHLEKLSERSSKKVFVSKYNYLSLLSHLQMSAKLPCIIFIFSRKKCTEFANGISNQSFTSKDESFKIKLFFDKCINRMSEKNRTLPQIGWYRDTCVRGIGVHHSGVLPIIREITELLFRKELIKVLVATETFAIGVNMPAKTVVFSALRKFSGQGHRNLLSSEYIQMAGRAGRRGQDTIGNVYIMVSSELPSIDDFKEIVHGCPLKITSRFRLTYGMILNLLSSTQTDDAQIEFIIKSSFSEFTQLADSQHIKNKIDTLTSKIGELESAPTLCVSCSHDIKKFYNLFHKYMESLNRMIYLSLLHKNQMAHFYTTGRLIFICLGKSDNCRPAIVLDPPSLKNHNQSLNIPDIRATVLFPVDPSDFNLDDLTKYSGPIQSLNLNFFEKGFHKMYISEVYLTRIILFTQEKIKINYGRLQIASSDRNPNMILIKHSDEARKLQNFFYNILSSFTPMTFFKSKYIIAKKVNDISETDLNFVNMEYIKSVFSLAVPFECLSCKSFVEHSRGMVDKWALEIELKQEHIKLSKLDLMLMPDYNKRVQVLKDLGLVDTINNLTFKGRVAIKFSNNFEIVLTELLFNGTLTKLSPEYLACVVSCFCEQGLTNMQNDISKFKYGLETNWNDICTSLNLIDKVEREHQLCTSERPVNPHLMEGIYEWAQGCQFYDFVKTTDIPEGNLIRYVLRLDEICRELEKAACHIGNLDLVETSKKCREMIKRDIVNTSSLYFIDNI